MKHLPPEVKQQLEEQKKQCVFCKIIKGEIPCKKVFEDQQTVAILDIYPAKKGHTILLPKEHYPIQPYMSPEETKHFFGIIPGLAQAIKEAMVATGINIFIANGGAAGQQAPHFMAHFFPRDEGDGFYNFLFKKKAKTPEEQMNLLKQNIPVLMQRFYQSNALSPNKRETPSYLKNVLESSELLYEDDKVLVVLPKQGVVAGHLEIYSKLEKKHLEKLSAEDATFFFGVASQVASLLFEGLKAQGTNIIVKSGHSDDNPDGKLSIHVLPRKQNDGLNSMLWQPKQPTYDLDVIAGKIKDKTWKINYKEKETKKVEKKKPEVIKLNSEKKETTDNPEDEIRKAISRVS